MISISPNTDAQTLQTAIDTAPSGSTIKLEAGTYDFDRTIEISRDDISIEGAGSGKTIVNASHDGPVFQIGPDVFQSEFSGEFEMRSTSADGATSIHFEDAEDLQEGNFLFLERENSTEFLNEINDTEWREDKPIRTAMVEVLEVRGDTVILKEELPFEFTPEETTVRRLEVLENVSLKGLTIDQGLGASDAGDFSNTLSQFDRVAAVSVNGTEGAHLSDIHIEEPGSLGFNFAKSLNLNAHGLSVDGAHNKGAGGNGYAFQIRDVYHSAFEDLSALDTRHAVVFASYTSATDNLVHISETNRDVNFHGGRDHSNTVIIDVSVRTDIEAEYMSPSLFFNNGAHYGAPTDAGANTVYFRNLRATKQDDEVTAHDDGARLEGLRGDDALTGGAGQDELLGGVGDDLLRGNGNADRIEGGEGDDFIEGGDGADWLVGGEGEDEIDGGAGDDRIFAGIGDDTVRDASGNNLIYMGEGDDTFQGVGPGTDHVNSGLGDDSVFLGDGDDRAYGGMGNDRLSGGAGEDRIRGGVQDDSLKGGDGNDLLWGGTGTDWIDGGRGNDKMNGGAGRDLFAFDLGDGNDRIRAFENGLDRLHFSATGLSFDDLRIVVDGQDTRIHYGDGDSILIFDSAGEIGQSDFIF